MMQLLSNVNSNLYTWDNIFDMILDYLKVSLMYENFHSIKIMDVSSINFFLNIDTTTHYLPKIRLAWIKI